MTLPPGAIVTYLYLSDRNVVPGRARFMTLLLLELLDVIISKLKYFPVE